MEELHFVILVTVCLMFILRIPAFPLSYLLTINIFSKTGFIC
jgi:hypothetical protein